VTPLEVLASTTKRGAGAAILRLYRFSRTRCRVQPSETATLDDEPIKKP